jgi:hypothetical protein
MRIASFLQLVLHLLWSISVVEASQYLTPRGADLKGREPWPPDEDGISRILYCWVQAAFRDTASSRKMLEQAVKNWNDRVGHAVQFVEKLDGDGNPIYCAVHDSDKNLLKGPTGRVMWNKDLGTLNVLEIKEGDSPQATIGWQPDNKRPGRYYLTTPSNPAGHSVAEYEHELGHVIGK